MERSVVDTNTDIVTEHLTEMEYSSNGRMKYNPEYFGQHGTPWHSDDLTYLADWYDIIGPEEMSLALERTPDSVMERVRVLRKEGAMTKLATIKNKKRALGKEPK